MPHDLSRPASALPELPAGEVSLRATLEANPDCVKLIGLDGRLEFLNGHGACLLGIEAAAIVGQPWASLWPSDAHPVIQGALHAAGAGRTARFEAGHLSSTGEKVWAVTVAPVFDLSGEVERILAVSHDVTAIRRADLRLRETEGILAALGHATPDLLYAKDLEGRMIYANPATLALVGRPADAVLGHTDSQFLEDPEEAKAVMANDRRIVAQGQAERLIEPVLDSRHGTVRYFESTKSPLRDLVTNQIIGIAGLSRDVTERRIATERDARLAAIVTSSADAIISFATADGRIMSWNQGAESLFGWTEAEAVGASVTLLLPPESDMQAQGGVFGPVMAGEHVRELETVRIDKHGRRIQVAITATRMLAPDGTVLGVSGIFRDIGDRLASEAALRVSESRWRTLAEALPHLVWTCSPDGSNDWLNLQWEQFTGVPAARHLQYGWMEAIHPEDRGALVAAWQHTVRTCAPFDHEARMRRADGAWRWFAKRALPLRDPSGAVLQWFGTSTDVTDEVEARKVLARSRAELEALVDARTKDLEQTQRRLAQAEKMTALGQLAGGIAHDLNNVLQAVQGGAGLIERNAAREPDVKRLAQLVTEAAQRGGSVTRRLLSFARQGDLRAEPVELPPLLESLHHLLAHTLGPQVIMLVECAPALLPILADRGQLETVLVNLATNARDAMPDGGTLTVQAAPDGERVRLSVGDDGSGMDEATLARASEPFFTTKPQGKGTGLGLAMARGFAEQSGGALAIRSRPGKGTVVELWLPFALEAAPAEPAPAPTAASGHSIVLVDDEPHVRTTLAEHLQGLGYAVAAYPSGEAALTMVERGEKLDALVTDLSMPGMDGLTLSAAVRARRPSLPVIVLTGYVDRATEQRAAGVRLLRKPATGDEVAASLAAMLAEPPQEHA